MYIEKPSINISVISGEDRQERVETKLDNITEEITYEATPGKVSSKIEFVLWNLQTVRLLMASQNVGKIFSPNSVYYIFIYNGMQREETQASNNLTDSCFTDLLTLFFTIK